MNCNIKVNKIDHEGLKSFVGLSKSEYDSTNAVTDYDQMAWKHLDTAHGPSTAINLNCKDVTVGRVLLQPRKIRVGEKEVNIAFATDSLVLLEFRRPLSNFFSIMKEIKHIHDFSLVLHTSNENTEAIYRNVLKFKCPISLSGYGVPVNLRAIFKKVVGFDSAIFEIINLPYRWLINSACFFTATYMSALVLTSDQPDENVLDHHISNHKFSGDLQIIRSLAFLKWRFNGSPHWKANVLHIYSKRNYVGYLAIREVELDGLKFTIIMDFSVNADLSWFDVLFIRFSVIKIAINNRSDAVFTLLNNRADMVKKFTGIPFFKVPDRLLPHKTPFFVHINDESIFSIDTLKKLHITLADLDYF